MSNTVYMIVDSGGNPTRNKYWSKMSHAKAALHHMYLDPDKDTGESSYKIIELEIFPKRTFSITVNLTGNSRTGIYGNSYKGFIVTEDTEYVQAIESLSNRIELID